MAAGAARGGGIRLAGVGKSFRGRDGTTVRALENLDLAVAAGEVGCLVGPTGCGKTTVLRLVAGLEEPDVGGIAADCGGEGARPARLGYLTQEHTLLPWLTALDNVALPLRLAGSPAREARERARGILEPLGLAAHAGLHPHELSGGMRQRAAMGRLLASEARCWLLDEPFAALDERTRHHLQDLLLGLVADRGLTVLFVTHSIDEAVFLADRLFVLSSAPGRVLEARRPAGGRPRERLAPGFGAELEAVRRVLEETLR